MILLLACTMDRPDTRARVVPTCLVVELDAESAGFVLTRTLRFEAIARFGESVEPDPQLRAVTYMITCEGERAPGTPKVSAYYADDAELRTLVADQDLAETFVIEIPEARRDAIAAEPPGWIEVPMRDVELIVGRDGVRIAAWPAGNMSSVLSRLIPADLIRRAAVVVSRP